MIKFHDIRIDDLSKIKNKVSQDAIISSVYSSYNLYALRRKYNTKIGYDEEVLYIQQPARNEGEYKSYLFPIGARDLKKAIGALQNHVAIAKGRLMLWGLDYEMLNELNKEFPNTFKVEEILNWSDYIYEKDKVVSCKTMKKSRRFSNKYKQRYRVEEILESNINEVIEFQYKWMNENKEFNNDLVSLNFEHDSIIEALKIWKYLPLTGYCIKMDENVIGFAYGFWQTKSCFVVHVIKTDKSIKGLTLFLFKYLVETVNVEYINFEEDIGIEGLRVFKTRLEPKFMLKKYKAIEK